LISQLELTDYIYAPGRVGYELLPEYFLTADVYVSSAVSDGTSISLLEAMACGLPVVVSDGFGNKEWVKPGENGWLVPPNDPAALAAALGSALEDPSSLIRMKSANISLASARADWNRNFPELIEFLHRLVGPSLVSNGQPFSQIGKSETS
jgi:glycosyltransferase involved in cell wall biosynthesis